MAAYDNSQFPLIAENASSTSLSPDSQERHDVRELVAMMGSQYDIALRVLRRSGGNIQDAKNMLFGEDDKAGR